MWAAPVAETPVLNNFLSSVAELVRSRDGAKLQDFLQLEPPLPPIYTQMISELRNRYPRDASNTETELQDLCEKLVPQTDAGSQWSSFTTFMRLYFSFLRDVNVENLLETYDLLKGLLK
jgi:hypothetical protein